MFPLFFRLLLTSFVLISPALLSGCLADKSLSFLDELQSTFEVANEEPEAQEHEQDDPELKLVNSESEVSLAQELEALDATGQWGETTTPVTEENDSEENEVEYDFPVVLNKQVQVYLDLFQNRQRKLFTRWLGRSGKYMELMEQELGRAGLPLDLAYLSMIESGYSQRAYSKAKAVGLWQFMSATGRQYGLSVDPYVDERRDAVKSTVAAVRFLSDLYREFGDWHLAVAAYNAGPGKIRGGLRRYKVDNFWDLAKHDYLSLETKRYVPKLIAAIILAKQPAQYGFTGFTPSPPLAFDTIEVGPNLELSAVALLADCSSNEIKELNQELKKGRTPPNRSSYTVNIPAGRKQLASSNLKRLHSYVATGFKSHTISRGETIASVCNKYNINTTTLLKVNDLRQTKLKAGTNLRIPYSTVKYQLLPEGSDAQLASYRENMILHKIKPGETISNIAKKYGVPEAMIVSWNGLKSVHKIRAGKQLALYIHNEPSPGTAKSGGTQAIASSKSKHIVADTTSTVPVLTATKKIDAQQEETEEAIRWYQVQNGDSLWTISRKFNISAANIRKWNNLKSNLIHPGNRLKLNQG